MGETAPASPMARGSPVSSTVVQARDRMSAPGSRFSSAGGALPPRKHRRSSPTSTIATAGTPNTAAVRLATRSRYDASVPSSAASARDMGGPLNSSACRAWAAEMAATNATGVAARRTTGWLAPASGLCDCALPGVPGAETPGFWGIRLAGGCGDAPPDRFPFGAPLSGGGFMSGQGRSVMAIWHRATLRPGGPCWGLGTSREAITPPGDPPWTGRGDALRRPLLSGAVVVPDPKPHTPDPQFLYSFLTPPLRPTDAPSSAADSATIQS